MKQETKLQRWIPSALFGLILACSTNISLAVGDLILNTFDSADELTASGNDWGGGSCIWDGTQDAGGTASRGALHVTVPYTDQGNNWQETQVGRNIPWPYLGLSSYVYVECDIKPDVTNSYPALDGNWCEVNPVIQEWAWTSLPSTRILGTNWTHIKTPLTPALTLAHLVMSFHRSYNAYPTNTISYWIDNIKLTVPPSPPPTLGLKPAGPPGLIVFASHAGDTYQRQLIRTVNGSYSFSMSNAPGPTTTYSMTITNFPGPAYAGFIAQMFLVPNYVNGDPAQTNMQNGATDSAIDWNSGSVIYWEIGMHPNGTAYSDWRYKTNEFGGQTMAFNDQPGGQYGTNGWAAGHLAALECATGPLGTWSLTFNNNTNVTITAPNGAQTNFVLHAVSADFFQDPVYAYFGIMPGDNARIGQSATFSELKISGSAMTIDDTFVSTGPPYTLDTTTWTKSAADGTGILIAPPDAAYWLSWTTPDPGFTNIWVASDVTLRLGDSSPGAGDNQWLELTGVPQLSWLNLLDRRTALVPWSALNAALGGTETNRTFFGLWKVVGP